MGERERERERERAVVGCRSTAPSPYGEVLLENIRGPISLKVTGTEKLALRLFDEMGRAIVVVLDNEE